MLSVAALAGAAVLSWGADARASETQLGLDADLAFPLDEVEVDSGAGFNGRIGQRLDLMLLTLTPEVSGGYYTFGGQTEPKVYRGLLGARLGLGAVVRAVAFAHAGVGHASFDVPSTVEDPGRTAFAYDAGLALDFTLLPLLDVGVHGAYNSIGGNDAAGAFDWATAGVNVELVF